MAGATVTASGVAPTVITGDDGTFLFDGLALWNNNQSGDLLLLCRQGRVLAEDELRHLPVRAARELDGRPPGRPPGLDPLERARRRPRSVAPTALVPTAGIPAGVEITPMSRPRQSLGDDGSVLVTYDLSSGNNPITVVRERHRARIHRHVVRLHPPRREHGRRRTDPAYRAAASAVFGIGATRQDPGTRRPTGSRRSGGHRRDRLPSRRPR